MLPSSLARPTRLILRKNIRLISHESEEAISRLKKPAQGGQNLTDRHQRLEKSLRGKEARSKHIEELPRVSAAIQSPYLQHSGTRTFKGLVVPEAPKPPEPDECCMSGCAICVHDLYQESLEAYDESVSSLRLSLSALGVPESEWPSNIKTTGAAAKEERNRDVSMDAFEEMEKALRRKNELNYLSPSQFVCKPDKVVRERRDTYSLDIHELYEGIRWLLLSNR